MARTTQGDSAASRAAPSSTRTDTRSVLAKGCVPIAIAPASASSWPKPAATAASHLAPRGECGQQRQSAPQQLQGHGMRKAPL